MWLMTTFGFFSVVRKPGDDDLTVRARARGDLERLKGQYLPHLGPVVEGGGTDYAFRAQVPVADFAEAVADIVRSIDYSNFKNAVASRHGHGRAQAYGKVWGDLLEISQEEL